MARDSEYYEAEIQGHKNTIDELKKMIEARDLTIIALRLELEKNRVQSIIGSAKKGY